MVFINYKLIFLILKGAINPYQPKYTTSYK